MSFDNRQELIETIGEIFPRLDAIKANPADIKAISDVLLALEKITPEAQKKLPIFLSEIPVSFSKLFEKLLMEPVENVSAGLALTAEGLALLKRAVEGENPQALVDGAETILLRLSSGFKITSPAVADMVVTKEEAGKVAAPAGPDNLILNAADEVLELLGLSQAKPQPKLRDKQLDAEDIFAEALAAAKNGETAPPEGEEKEEKSERWTPESGEPPPISQTGRFRDIINLLEKGVQPAPQEEEQTGQSGESGAEEGEDQSAIEQIRSILEGKTQFPGPEEAQPEVESTLQHAKEAVGKPVHHPEPSHERQEEAEAAIREALQKAQAPEERLGPDGRRQMEAEAAMEHTRETIHEPAGPADWSAEMERQREAEEAVRIGREEAQRPAAAPEAAGSQADVEAIFGQALAGQEAPPPEREAISREQRTAEEIMAHFGQPPESVPEEAPVPQEAPAPQPAAAEERPAPEFAPAAEPAAVQAKEETAVPAPPPPAPRSAKQAEAEEIFALFTRAKEPAPAEAHLIREPGVEQPAEAAQEPAAQEAVPAVEAETAGWEYEKGEEADEESAFFAPMAGGEVSRAAGEEESPADPLSEKLSAVASEVTLMEADMADKKSVSSVMLAFEEIHAELSNRQSSWEVTACADVLAGLYERILMEGADDSRKAVDLTINGVMILSAYLENPVLEPVKERAASLLADLESLFGVRPQRTPLPVAKQAAAPAAPRAAEKAVEPASAEARKSARFLGYESVQLATSEDLLIYTEFVSEVNDAMAHIESDLLELESSPEDMELINDIFRGYHSMKGAAGFLGVNTVNLTCHEAESLLDKFRKKTMVSDQSSVDLLLKSLDLIRLVNEGLGESCEKAKMNMPGAFLEIPRYDAAPLIAAFEETSARKEAQIAQQAAEKAEAEAEAEAEAQEKEEEKTALLGQILLDEGKVSEEDVELALRAQKEKRPLGEILVEMGVVDQPSLEQALMDQADRKKRIKSASLKIDTEKLDTLLEMVGELVISQSIVSQEAAFLKGERTRLARNIQSLGKITKGIQDQVMTLRMVPLKQTFQKMSRLVRDLSKKMKKQVAFHVTGEETEIDKTIIEELNDPLVHLLRNAMDHGVESPEERAARNKPRMGNIWLNAYHRGGNVYIEVIDDGRGLDKEKIKRKAAEKGLLEEDAEISDQEAHALVMMPGFSTHDQATDISGRGVGMDVVRSNIDALGGRLDISSKPGEGSEFTVRLPLTMAIVDGMIVRIGEERFVIPTIAIRESIRPRREDVSTFKAKGEMINVRGKLLPLVRLRKFLGMQNGASHNPWEGLVIIVESDEREFGFMVDDLLGQQQVVIKSLDKRFKGLPGISGGTILGDGRVGLILDVGSVVEYN